MSKTEIKARGRVQVFFDDPGLTKQSEKDSCDISRILKRYYKEGIITHVQQNHGFYDDLVNVQDYHASMNQVIAAQEAFSSLPSQLRARFGNDPGLFIDFVGDPSNKAEMEKLGLLAQSEIPVSSPKEGVAMPSEQLPT